jgi:SAM-dependent MidA family methyltransferase
MTDPELERVERVRGQLLEEMATAGGAIPFSRFMEVALYRPGDGYYEHRSNQVGVQGDFYTSVSVGPVFGELLASQFWDWAVGASDGPVTWVEAGAHDGRLAADILGWLAARRPAARERVRYVIVEPSPVRRAWQAERLAAWGDWVSWTDSIPETQGVVFSNELLDAFPIERFGWDAAAFTWYRRGVGCGAQGFIWTRLPVPDALRSCLPVLPDALLAVLPDGFTWECSPGAEAWWGAAARALRRGWLVTFDYGLTEMEFFSPGRLDGTLRGYRGHRLVDDVLVDPGAVDLTAHVNFTRIERAGLAAGLAEGSLLEQPQFLTRVMSRTLGPTANFGEWTPARVRQFQTLTHPQHLGRAFRVLVQGVTG